MPQVIHNDNYNIRASNANVTLNRGSEIVLNGVMAIGGNNFGVTITNHSSSSSSLTNINILGSEDNSFYYYILQNIFPSGIAPGQTLHTEFSTTSHYLQVVVGTNILATLDAHLIGTP